MRLQNLKMNSTLTFNAGIVAALFRDAFCGGLNSLVHIHLDIEGSR